jgi:branched-chain amino acid transport system ATP-binding protein
MTSIPKKYQQEIHEILETLEMREKKDTLAGDLSGGQMRLLEIARLYLQKTKLYLLDEPTAGVSPKLKSKVVDMIKKIIDKDKMVIIVEHDFEFLAQFVDSFALMNEGKIILQGTYKEIKES